ncbi:MAG: T9SS type A sorting domain-containing protein [Candidatus Lokiarchaeota archaeon]|nr:T9SS type A sorting domain-containing protein [Candidatus Lokiarchaeota archaeon]
MKKLYLFFILFNFITLTVISNAQTVIPPGDVSGTWTWGGSPYEIQGEITIPNGLTLAIEPGVLVEFQGHYKLNVQGRLLAMGTETDTITFTINDTTGFSNPNIPDGGWHGIRFSWTPLTNDSSKFVYCKLQYGKAIGSIPDNIGGAIWVDHFNDIIISNCLITNNYASYSGGGIALYYSSPKITSNTISYNLAMGGGGINCADGSNPEIENNLIVNNSAERGGGISFFDANPILTNTIIENNDATSDGGGILILDNSRIILENVTLKGNTSSLGGGIHCYRSDLIIDGSSFINNSERAIAYDCGDTITFTYQLNVTNSIFTNNTATSSEGAIQAIQEDSARVNVFVDKCVFTNNLASSISALRLKGDHLNFTLNNSIFSTNEAKNMASGVMFNRCTGAVLNCLFASNKVDTVGEFYNLGSVVVWEGANVDFMNCTFADNSASYGAGLFVGYGGSATTTNCIFGGNSTSQIALYTLDELGGTLTVNYCNVQGGENSVNILDSLSTLNWGNNNIDENSLFVNPSNGDYHLQNGSHCIAAGIDSIEIAGFWHHCPPTDIEGNPRPNPTGSMPDMGAYESPEGIVGIGINPFIHPDEYALYQNYPNPFNPTTTIKYQIPELSFITLKVYDVLGSEIITLINEEKPVGNYEVEFDATNLSSGIYFYRISVSAWPSQDGQAGSFVETKKMILLK